MNRGQLESDIERRHRRLAMSYGWFVEKMQAVRRGFPDRFYASVHPKYRCQLCNRGRVVLIEWKRPGKPPKPQQRVRHEQLRAAGVEVHVIDSLEQANRILGIGDEETASL